MLPVAVVTATRDLLAACLNRGTGGFKSSVFVGELKRHRFRFSPLKVWRLLVSPHSFVCGSPRFLPAVLNAGRNLAQTKQGFSFGSHFAGIHSK